MKRGLTGHYAPLPSAAGENARHVHVRADGTDEGDLFRGDASVRKDFLQVLGEPSNALFSLLSHVGRLGISV